MENINENDVLDLLPSLADLIDEEPKLDKEQDEKLEIEEVNEEQNEELEDENLEDESKEESEEEIEEDEDQTINGDVQVAQSFYEMLKERGIVPDKEINSWEEAEEELDAYRDKLPEQVKQSMIESVSPTAKSFIEYALTKPNLTEEDLQNYFSTFNKDQIINNIETNEQAREILKEQFSKQFKDSVVTTLLDTLEDEDDLINKAKELNEAKAQKLIDDAKAEEERLTLESQERLNNINKEFDNQPWKEEHKTKLKESFMNGELDTKIKTIVTDPKALVQLINLINYYDDESKTFNLDTFFKKASTKSVNSYKENIKRGLQNSGTTTKTKAQKTTFDFDKFKPVT